MLVKEFPKWSCSCCDLCGIWLQVIDWDFCLQWHYAENNLILIHKGKKGHEMFNPSSTTTHIYIYIYSLALYKASMIVLLNFHKWPHHCKSIANWGPIDKLTSGIVLRWSYYGSFSYLIYNFRSPVGIIYIWRGREVWRTAFNRHPRLQRPGNSGSFSIFIHL